MKLENLINIIERKYPVNIAMDFDNVGLLVGDTEKEINKVMVTLDITSSIIDYAKTENVDLIISHHPMIFNPIKRINMNEITGRKIIKAISNDIAIYAGHTNVDGAIDGLNDYVINLLQLEGRYIYTDLSYNLPIRYFELDYAIDIDDIVEIVKNKLKLPSVNLVFDEYYTSRKIKTFALTTGSGMSFLDDVKDKVDLFITGDIKHHDALDALEQGVILIDFGHYGSENKFVDLMGDFLIESSDLEIVKYYSKPVLKIR